MFTGEQGAGGRCDRHWEGFERDIIVSSTFPQAGWSPASRLPRVQCSVPQIMWNERREMNKSSALAVFGSVGGLRASPRAAG